VDFDSSTLVTDAVESRREQLLPDFVVEDDETLSEDAVNVESENAST